MAVGAGAAFEVRLRFMVVLRYLDVVLVAIVTAPALALGAPMLGYALGGGGWVLQRILAAVDKRWLNRVADPRKRLGVNLFEAFGRIWLLAGAIIVSGVVARADGLTAALVILGAYSVALPIRVIAGPPQGKRNAPGSQQGKHATPGSPQGQRAR